MGKNITSENRDILMLTTVVCEEYATNKTNKKFSGWNTEDLNEFTSIAKEIEKSRETQSLELNYKESKTPLFELVVNKNETLGFDESAVPYMSLVISLLIPIPHSVISHKMKMMTHRCLPKN